MAYRNHFTDKFVKKSSPELEEILNSSAHVHDAKLAAKWILQERGSLPDQIPLELRKESSPINAHPDGFTLLEQQSTYDRSKLRNNLIQVRKDSRLELIIYTAFVFVAPYFAFRPGQTPLIERMTYWQAVGYISLFLVVFFLGSFIYKVYPKIRALQTNRKKILVGRILNVKESIFNKYHILCLEHESVKEYKLFKGYPAPKENDFVKLELSEYGNQLINIEAISEEKFLGFKDKKDFQEVQFSSFFEVFTRVKADQFRWSRAFYLLIPKEGHFVTPIILLLNFVVFIVMIIAGVDIHNPEVIDIANWGGNVKVLTLNQGQYWRLLTNVFVHIGIPHLLMNSIGFLFAAVFLENKLGRRFFLTLYLITGVLASLTSALWNTNVVSAGASGAIFGLYGFLLISLVSGREQERKLNESLIATIFIYVIYNLIMGLASNIDNAAHIGGLLAGIIIGILHKLKIRLQ